MSSVECIRESLKGEPNLERTILLGIEFEPKEGQHAARAMVKRYPCRGGSAVWTVFLRREYPSDDLPSETWMIES
jgi:hypothetical protein